MKNYSFVCVLLSILIIACNTTPTLEKMTDKEYVKRAVNNNFPSPDAIIIKDIHGKVLSKEEMFALYEEGKYTTDFYKNKKGEIVEVIVRLSTPADQKLEAEINRKLNAGPPITISDIDCTKISPLLDEAFRRDQEIRKTEEAYDKSVDRKNLELILSIDKNCGFPQGPDFKKEINIIWLIIQHNTAEYRKKYIDYFIKANAEGAIESSSIALMQDRILMDDGLPQLYGSQLLGNKLYNLRDASTVDQRRASVGLEPLKEYLDRFGVAFEVEQE